ncbi:hypothetical protein [Wenzhouxiangella sediminis]|uniref:hypothetical protein n=1 Tax=Wenzhouxiangella sediminis TaxID=1792836 RepID=UPI0011C03473|nr:hypothetical protein [Wenzhouxiangella sediminis]
MFCAALWLPGWGEEQRDWRLIGFSVASETSVFSDSLGQLATYRPGDEVADGQWRLQSIAANHVVLVPATRPSAQSSTASLVLGAGEDVPDIVSARPGTSIYYEVQGIFLDNIETQAEAGGQGSVP